MLEASGGPDEQSKGGESWRTASPIYVGTVSLRRRRSAATPAQRVGRRLQWGLCEFDGVRVELNLEPPIRCDREQPAFFRAILEFDDRAMPEVEELDEWRSYVHANGAMPKDPGAKLPLVTEATVRRHTECDVTPVFHPVETRVRG